MIKAPTANQNPSRFAGRNVPRVAHLSNMAGDKASGYPFLSLRSLQRSQIINIHFIRLSSVFVFLATQLECVAVLVATVYTIVVFVGVGAPIAIVVS